MKLPSFQFYPGDWMKDPALRSVSLEGRGDVGVVRDSLARRDTRDRTRPTAPLQIARNATVIDSSSMAIEEPFQQ